MYGRPGSACLVTVGKEVRVYSHGVSDPMLRFPATPSSVPSSPVSPPPSSLPVSPAPVPLSGRSRSGQQWQLPDWNVGTGTEGLEHWNKLEVNTSTYVLELKLGAKAGWMVLRVPSSFSHNIVTTLVLLEWRGWPVNPRYLALP